MKTLNVPDARGATGLARQYLIMAATILATWPAWACDKGPLITKARPATTAMGFHDVKFIGEEPAPADIKRVPKDDVGTIGYSAVI